MNAGSWGREEMMPGLHRGNSQLRFQSINCAVVIAHNHQPFSQNWAKLSLVLQLKLIYIEDPSQNTWNCF
jgi:hypothetical protein